MAEEPPPRRRGECQTRIAIGIDLQSLHQEHREEPLFGEKPKRSSSSRNDSADFLRGSQGRGIQKTYLAARRPTLMREQTMDAEVLKTQLSQIIEALPTEAPLAEENSEAARERIVSRLNALSATEPAVEFQFTLADAKQQRLFAALARRYELKPFRYAGQLNSTIMLKAPERFVDETFWPQYQQLTKTLNSWMDEITTQVIREVLHSNGDDVEEMVEAPSSSSNAAGPAT